MHFLRKALIAGVSLVLATSLAVAAGLTAYTGPAGTNPIQFPAALPFIFAGAKVAVTLAVIGAVIGEFIGSVGGLGNLLLTANSQLDSPLAWAALIWLSVLGILLFAAVVIAERIVMPWSDVGHH